VRIRRALRRTLSLLGQSKAELSILFVDDRRMKELNATFRGVSETTNVLSFPQIEFRAQGSEYILGDIVISIPQATLQAEAGGRGFYDEVYRLLTHGILHLLGYNHEKSRDARIMREKEEEILRAIGVCL